MKQFFLSLLSPIGTESMTRFCLLFSVVVPITCVCVTWSVISFRLNAVQEIGVGVLGFVGTCLAGGWYGKTQQEKTTASKENGKNAPV